MIKDARKRRAAAIGGMILFVVSIAFLAIDNIYKISQGISYANRQLCIVNRSLPRLGFILFENTIELGFSVYIGIFLASLIEHYFMRIKRFVPRNPFSAFLYGSVIPVCSCSAIPMIKTMRDNLNMRTIIAFVVAAPLLNPYIIFISFSVLGPFYATARIAASFVLSVSAGYVVEAFSKDTKALSTAEYKACSGKSCDIAETNLFIKTLLMFKSILPYLAIGGGLSVLAEYFLPNKGAIISKFVNDTLLGNLAVIAVGIPLYLCNGADVFILKPLLCAGLSTGTAIEFSLTSTAICITSFFMLVKFLGKKLTFILVGHIAIVCLALGWLINLIGKALNVSYS